MAATGTAPRNEFRDEKYSKLESHFVGLDKNDVYAYSKTLLSRREFNPIFDPWVESVKTPFSGITTDGMKIENIYKLEDNGAPTEEMVAAANRVLEVLTQEEKAQVVCDLDAEHWHDTPQGKRPLSSTQRWMGGELLPKWRYNPAVQRHLAGAYQDNRRIPYDGLRCSELTDAQQTLLWDVVENFQNLLPEKPLPHRLAAVRAHLNET